MVKVKIIKARWPEEKLYIGGIYEAFKLTYIDQPTEYAVQVSSSLILLLQADCCEEIKKNDVIINQLIGEKIWMQKHQKNSNEM